MNHNTKKRIRRGLSILTLCAGFAITVLVAWKAYCLKEWNTITASLAVIVAILTLYITMKMIWKNEDEQEPEFLIDWDFKSSTVTNYLTITNIGGGSAYDVSIEWTKVLKNFRKEPVTFGQIPILNKNQKLKTIVSTIPKTWENAKEYGDENDNFTGIIKYKIKKNNKNYQEFDFCVSLGHKKYRNDYEDLEQEFHAQGKKIVKQLEILNESLNNFLTRNEEDN